MQLLDIDSHNNNYYPHKSIDHESVAMPKHPNNLVLRCDCTCMAQLHAVTCNNVHAHACPHVQLCPTLATLL